MARVSAVAAPRGIGRETACHRPARAELSCALALRLRASAGGAAAWGARQRPAAERANVISVRDKSKLHLVKAVGETLIEEGPATGTLPGRVRIQLNLNVEELTAKSRFTLYLHGGTLTGQAPEKPPLVTAAGKASRAR